MFARASRGGDCGHLKGRDRARASRQLASLRAEVCRWLAPLALAGDTEDHVVLAVNEAASNCIEHDYTTATDQDTVDVSFWTEPHALCLDVTDHGVCQTPSDQPTGAAGESRSCNGSWRSF